jgi:hypothetical protein
MIWYVPKGEITHCTRQIALSLAIKKLEDKATWGWPVPSDSYQTSKLRAEQSLAQCGSKRMSDKGIMMVDSLLSHGKGKKLAARVQKMRTGRPTAGAIWVEVGEGASEWASKGWSGDSSSKGRWWRQDRRCPREERLQVQGHKQNSTQKIELFLKTYPFTCLMSWNRM